MQELMGIPKVRVEDRVIVKRVCELVGLRAARLAAAGVAAVVRCARRRRARWPCTRVFTVSVR